MNGAYLLPIILCASFHAFSKNTVGVVDKSSSNTMGVVTGTGCIFKVNLNGNTVTEACFKHPDYLSPCPKQHCAKKMVLSIGTDLHYHWVPNNCCSETVIKDETSEVIVEEGTSEVTLPPGMGPYKAKISHGLYMICDGLTPIDGNYYPSRFKPCTLSESGLNQWHCSCDDNDGDITEDTQDTLYEL